MYRSDLKYRREFQPHSILTQDIGYLTLSLTTNDIRFDTLVESMHNKYVEEGDVLTLSLLGFPHSFGVRFRPLETVGPKEFLTYLLLVRGIDEWKGSHNVFVLYPGRIHSR